MSLYIHDFRSIYLKKDRLFVVDDKRMGRDSAAWIFQLFNYKIGLLLDVNWGDGFIFLVYAHKRFFVMT